jgi:parvulin-like peptidyl-prolyl isomerase
VRPDEEHGDDIKAHRRRVSMRLLSALREPALAIAVLGFAFVATTARAADAPASKSDAPAAADSAKGAATPAAPAAAGSEAVARIGDVVITRNELEDASRRMFEIYKRMAAAGQAPQGAENATEPNEEQKRKILDNLVGAKVLEKLVKKADVKVPDADVTERIKMVMDSQGVKSEEDFVKLLQQRGLTLDQVKSQVKDELSRQKYVENLTKDVAATDAEIKALYDKMKADGQMDLKEDALDVACVLIRPSGADDAAWAEARKKIDAIRERIVKGKEDFAKVAKETSQDPEVKRNGGVYPLVTQKSGPFGPEFGAAASAVPDGEISGPVKTKSGWCIVKVVAKRAPGLLKFEDAGVKQFLTGRVVSQKTKDLLDKTIADARTAMKVEILLPAAGASAAAPAAPPATAAPKKDGAPNSLLVPGST